MIARTAATEPTDAPVVVVDGAPSASPLLLIGPAGTACDGDSCAL